MKKLLICISISTITCFCLVSCEKWINEWISEHLGRHIVYGFENTADYEISVYSLLCCPDYSNPILYPDTSLPFQRHRFMPDIMPNHAVAIFAGSFPIDSTFEDYHVDTMSIFVISKDTLDLYGWDDVRNSYNILQRYDMSINDFNQLVDLYFPPTEAMRGFKMWPPYGTYDAHGNRVE